jgi:alpha-mannosidase
VPPASETVGLDYNVDVASSDNNRRDGRMDREGRAMPAEMLPGEIVSEGVQFKLGSFADGQKNAVECNSQTIALPKGRFNRLYILAAAANEEASGVFRLGGKDVRLTVQPWTGFVGQYDNRIWDNQFNKIDRTGDASVVSMKTGFIKRDTIAWFCTHRHQRDLGNESYQFSYIFKYAMDVPEGAANVTLPDNDSIKIFAMTLSNNENDATKTATPLYDDFTGRKPVNLRLAQKK